MPDIYDQFDNAFRGVGAYAVHKDGACIGRVTFKFPRDGAGRLWCYVHVWGTEMTRGYASGFGYDKQTAACESAVQRMHAEPRKLEDGAELAVPPDAAVHVEAWRRAILPGDGQRWKYKLEAAGYTVQHVI